jgi:hypothetical protein
MKDMERQLGIMNPDDWYLHSYRQVVDAGGGALLRKFRGLYPLLLHLYPEFPWQFKDRAGDNLQGKKSQNLLAHYVEKLLPPSTRVYTNYKEDTFKYETTGKWVELDVYVPSFKLAFEYQGEHHYEDAHTVFGNMEDFQARDEEKDSLCQSAGITLIRIPFWWDHELASLAATVHYHRPDIVPHPPQDAKPMGHTIVKKLRRY